VADDASRSTTAVAAWAWLEHHPADLRIGADGAGRPAAPAFVFALLSHRDAGIAVAATPGAARLVADAGIALAGLPVRAGANVATAIVHADLAVAIGGAAGRPEASLVRGATGVAAALALAATAVVAAPLDGVRAAIAALSLLPIAKAVVLIYGATAIV
jgi:hypothetical protein